MKSPNEALLNLATSSKKLETRAAGNQAFSSSNFNSWVNSLFEQYSMNDVLDICCGTGNQLVIYAEKSVRSITGLDISTQLRYLRKLALYQYHHRNITLTS